MTPSRTVSPPIFSRWSLGAAVAVAAGTIALGCATPAETSPPKGPGLVQAVARDVSSAAPMAAAPDAGPAKASR